MTDLQPERPALPDRTPRLRRSRHDRMLGGVCGGIARTLDIDPVLIRIAAVALALSGGLGVLVYVIAWIVIPEAEDGAPEAATPRADRHAVAVTVGACLVGLGGIMLLRVWLPGFGAGLFWPVIVVVVGVLVLVSARR